MNRPTIEQLLRQYSERTLSPVDMTQQSLDSIARTNDTTNAFITVCPEKALDQARIAELRYSLGQQSGRLEGVPISVKDMIDTAGIRTTYGSAIDANNVPEEDAAIVGTLRQQGAVNLGKTNLHEYAFGTTSENAFYGSVLNPWNQDHVAGGSSGGSAAAIATGIGFASIGTDTGGSIRIPAAACGVVGLKPTYGLLKTTGALNISWTLDHTGPITRNVEDMASVMEALTGQKYNEHLQGESLEGIRIGVPTKYFNERLQPDVKAAFDTSLARLGELGAVLIDVNVDYKSEDIDDVLIIEAAEAGYIHERRILGSLDKYGSDVRTALGSSHDISALSYIRALGRRRTIKENTSALFDVVDYIATPTMPITAPRLTTRDVTIGGETEDIFSCMIRYTSIFDMSGHPALSIPCGLSGDGLPIGLQLAGTYLSERSLLKTARVFEQHYLGDIYRGRDQLQS
ncbi:amidase [Celeribacter halophilus]|uniref:amidase n=1 Tax=Celeribacter halophilus TaxID=576117 RepID=UPI003A8CAC91